MGETLPLPVRQPVNRAMAMTLEDQHANRRNDHALLERITAGLRALHDTRPTAPSQADLPIRSYAQPDQVAP